MNTQTVNASRTRWNHTLCGSFTMEAAVVTPMTMLILMAVIFLSFFVYDQVTLDAAAEYAVLERAEQSLMGRGDASGAAERLTHVLMAAGETSVSVSGDADHCSGEVTAVFHVPLLMVDQLTSGALRTIEVHMERHAFDGRKKLLLYKSICDGAADLTRAGR